MNEGVDKDKWKIFAFPIHIKINSDTSIIYEKSWSLGLSVLMENI